MSGTNPTDVTEQFDATACRSSRTTMSKTTDSDTQRFCFIHDTEVHVAFRGKNEDLAVVRGFDGWFEKVSCQSSRIPIMTNIIAIAYRTNDSETRALRAEPTKIPGIDPSSSFASRSI